LITFFFITKVRRSVLEALEVNENPEAMKLITEEFFEGRQNSSHVRTTEEEKILRRIAQKMSNYTTDKKKSFVYMTSQNCQDMLLYVGKQTYTVIKY
jgi:hypothetical protein